jgi:glycosyltransferase involved in cell wall biosynthesis
LKIAYFSSGTSLYDAFFLEKLGLENEIRLLTFRGDSDSKQNSTNVILPFPIGRLPARDGIRRYLGLPLRVVVLRRSLRSLKPDVLVGCSLYGLYGLIAVLSGFKPTAVFLWGSETLIAPKSLPFRTLVKYVMSKASLIVVDSDAQVAACRNLGCRPDKIVSLPWVDVNDLISPAVSETRSGFRKRFGWAPADVVVTCTRNHYPAYNVETVLRCVPLVLERVPGVRFLFIGSGPLTEKFREMATSMGVKDAVHFTGHLPRSNLLAYLKNSDIYVSSSVSDGTSSSLIEAMASPLPCIVSDIPGNRPWVENGTNGYVFPPRDHHLLSTYISQVAADEGLRGRFAKAALEAVREKADWRENFPSLRSALLSLVGAG